MKDFNEVNEISGPRKKLSDAQKIQSLRDKEARLKDQESNLKDNLDSPNPMTVKINQKKLEIVNINKILLKQKQALIKLAIKNKQEKIKKLQA